MAQIVQAGAINIAALQVAGVYIQIVPPTLIINGVPTNVAGLVGSASWGPVNAPTLVGSYANYAAQFGDMVARKYDAGTHVWSAYQQGNQVVFQVVRVTDGTDTAAAVTVQSTCLTLTSKYTGSFGNLQQVTFGTGAAANSIRATLFTPGVLPEVFDNILQGVQGLAVTAGTGYTSVPALNIPAPTSGVQALASASLITSGTPTVGAGGAGYVIGDTMTLSNGVVVKVATVSSGAVATFVAQGTSGTALGSITSGATPANPVAQISSSGSGTGATVNLAWVLGPATIINPGAGYVSAPTPTITGGGGSGGSYAASIAYWINIANAINLGQGGYRGPSANFIATNGTGTAAPTLATLTLTGGTDGAGGVTGNTLIGADSLPRTGMYALRGLGCSLAALADCDLSTTWSTQVAFGLFEGAYMIGTTPSGDTISNAQSAITTAGIDSYAMKLMLGDWVYIADPINKQTRLVSPQGFVLGVLGNLAPNRSSLNKPMNAIVGTQKSATGVAYTNADLQALALARLDVIANPIARGAGFGCQNGRNTSSSPAIRGDNYTRMTNYLAATLGAGLGIYVGTLGTTGQARRLKSTIDSFMSNVQRARLIGDPDNAAAPQPWKTTVDVALITQGIEQVSLQVTYQSIVEIIVLSIQGGQTVTISRTTTPTGA
jgi:hypothetical protein